MIISSDLGCNSEPWSFLYLLCFTVVQLLENRLGIDSPSFSILYKRQTLISDVEKYDCRP